MVSEYAGAIKGVAKRVILAPLDREVWRNIREGVAASLALLMFIVFLLTFPVSVPVLTWLYVWDGRKRARDTIVAKQRMRDRIHKNGR